MNAPGNRPQGHQDDRRVPPSSTDGGRVRPALRYIALAVALAGGCAGYLAWRVFDGDASPETHADVVEAMPDGVAPVEGSDLHAGDDAPQAAPDARPRPAPDDLAAYVAPGQPAPKMEDVIETLHDAGIHGGLGAFNPPGTSPPLVGLAVPEDFPLPEGYVRHYQATDDGQRIEPILMFSPDFVFRDRNGRIIDIPENRVVPPHLAPPGLPLRPIDIPPPRDSRGS